MGHQQGSLFTWSCHMQSLLSTHHEGMAGLMSWPCVILRKPSCSFA